MRASYLLISVSTLIAVVMSVSSSYAKIDPGTCAGAWLLDEDGANEVEDISGNGNTGIVKGNPKWDEGKFGNALACDGLDDYVDCGAQDSLSSRQRIEVIRSSAGCKDL